MKKKATVNLRSSRRVTAKQGTVKQKLTDAQPAAVHLSIMLNLAKCRY